MEQLIKDIVFKTSLTNHEKCKRPISSCSVCGDIAWCPYDRLLESKRSEVYSILKNLFKING